MSDFTDWLDENHPGTVLRNGKEYLDADLQDLEDAFNAGRAQDRREGMEEAEEIVSNCITIKPGTEVANMALVIAVEAIRKEIETSNGQ